MSDEITIEGKEYFSSKRASELSGYAQDYIGQLARGGAIDARRIGGLWYIRMDSLQSYKKESDSASPEQPKARTAPEHDTFISFEGRDYISAARASRLTAYNQDYVGQLARSGKVLSRQVGNRWYLDREGLLAHKREKDALLAAVQTESVGLKKNDSRAAEVQNLSYAGAGPFLIYTRDERDLLPVLKGEKVLTLNSDVPDYQEEIHQVPIHIVRPNSGYARDVSRGSKSVRKERSGVSGKTIFYGSLAATALTIVIVLSFEFSSIRESSIYAFRSLGEPASAGAPFLGISRALGTVGNILEGWIVPETIYRRSF